MTFLLILLALIAGVAIIATLRDVHDDGSHAHRPAPSSHYPDVFDHRFVA
jgi:hypothetical protein